MNHQETALITGASSGIGLELAKQFAQHNINLLLVARNTEKLDQLKQELESRHDISVKNYSVDLSEVGGAEIVYKQVKNEQITYLVNNAGIGSYGEFTESDIAKIEQMMVLNMITLVKLTRLLLPQIIQSKGRIMNLGSTGSFQPVPYFAVYGATKSFVLSFSEALNYEIQDTGVTVTTLCPGATSSGFQKATHMEHSGYMKHEHFVTPQEVAQFGYEAMMQGKTIAIHGMRNALNAFAVRLMPRSLVTKISAKISK